MGLGGLRSRFRSSPWIRPARLARVRRQARSGGHFDWSGLISEDQARWDRARAEADGPCILIATDVGLHFGASRFDSLLAVALTLRGAQIDVLLCDGVLPACMIGDSSWYPDLGRFIERGPQADFCDHCFPPALAAWQQLGIDPLRLGSFITDEDRRGAAVWADRFSGDMEKIRGDPVADQGLAGALRFFARSQIEDRTEARSVLRSFLLASYLSNRAAQRLMKDRAYDVVVLHHGIYVPQGPVLAAARGAGARIVSWNVGYRKQTFIFSHDDSYHHTMITEPRDRWEGLKLSDGWQGALDRYLHSRRHGDNDWIVFGKGTEFDAAGYLKRRGVDPRRPLFLALTNVAWDAQLHYPASSFASMGEWLVDTVRWFAERPSLQLVIRVHPAELTGSMPAHEKAADILAAAFPTIPSNVFLVGPADPISTYSLIEAAQAALIFATKAGIEVVASGRLLVVAGDAWTRGKGLSIDAESRESYREILDELVDRPPPAKADIERARQYAFHYFFRRMIPIRATRPENGWPPFTIAAEALSELEVGADIGLDVVCRGIVEGTAFEYPAETLDPTETAA